MEKLSPWERRKRGAVTAIERYDETGKAGCAIPAGIAVGALVTFVSEQIIRLLQEENSQNESKYAVWSLVVCAVAAGVLVRQTVMHLLAKHHMESLAKSHPVVFEQALAEVTDRVTQGTRKHVAAMLEKRGEQKEHKKPNV